METPLWLEIVKLLVALAIGFGAASYTLAVNAKLKQIDDLRTMYADLFKSHALFGQSFSRMQNFCEQYAAAKSANSVTAALDVQTNPEYLDILSKLNSEHSNVASALYRIRLADPNASRVELAERYHRAITFPILLCYNLAGVWDSFKKIDDEVSEMTKTLAVSFLEERPTRRFLLD